MLVLVNVEVHKNVRCLLYCILFITFWKLKYYIVIDIVPILMIFSKTNREDNIFVFLFTF